MSTCWLVPGQADFGCRAGSAPELAPLRHSTQANLGAQGVAGRTTGGVDIQRSRYRERRKRRCQVGYGNDRPATNCDSPCTPAALHGLRLARLPTLRPRTWCIPGAAACVPERADRSVCSWLPGPRQGIIAHGLRHGNGSKLVRLTHCRTAAAGSPDRDRDRAGGDLIRGCCGRAGGRTDGSIRQCASRGLEVNT